MFAVGGTIVAHRLSLPNPPGRQHAASKTAAAAVCSRDKEQQHRDSSSTGNNGICTSRSNEDCEKLRALEQDVTVKLSGVRFLGNDFELSNFFPR